MKSLTFSIINFKLMGVLVLEILSAVKFNIRI